ncbi:hypothetical protein [Corynebacterium amycolatum]|uniref:hypothetical protein n=1 Tax=Corynebacterium amycolatum TaxID=43765 RepID=UPI003EDFFA81
MATTITEHAPTRRTSRGASATVAGAKTKTRQRGRSARTKQDLYQRRRFGRTGSQQVISVRGRRVTTSSRDNHKFAGAALMIFLVVAGIVMAMFLSGISTSTSLKLDAAQTKEKELRNQLEVLERDVAYMKSTGAIAQRAVEEGMVNPEQPAVLTTDPEGKVVEVRPGDEKQQKIIDLNSESPNNPHAPSSNPKDTESVPGMQAPAIEEAHPRPNGLPATAPYAPQNHAPAPAPAPVPAPAPEAEAPAPAPEAPAPAPEAPEAPAPEPAPAP